MSVFAFRLQSTEEIRSGVLIIFVRMGLRLPAAGHGGRPAARRGRYFLFLT